MPSKHLRSILAVIGAITVGLVAQQAGNVATNSTGNGGSGSGSAQYFINCGGTSFSQCGLQNLHNGTLFDGWFDNLQGVGTWQNFPTFFDDYALYDNTDGADRIESINGTNGPLFLQPHDGAVSVGPYQAAMQLLTVGGSISAMDPTILGTESLTNPNLTSGTSWTATNDCALSSDAATCSFSAGTASTIQQASGTLAVAGHGNRGYKFTYVVSAVSGAPTAALTSTFGNTGGNFPISLDIVAGSHTLYFQSVAAPGNFVITTTLTTGQAFTLDTFSLKEIEGGNNFIGGRLIMGNCSSGASPAVCGSYSSGAVAIPTGSNPTLTVNTTAITAGSKILLSNDATTAPGAVTCNTTAATEAVLPYVSARVGGTSFTIAFNGTISTNPLCVNFMVIN